MDSIKRSIVFLSCSTGIALLLTYLFSVIEFSGKLISSSFAFAILSGIFASLFVMLLVEIKKYFNEKRSVEDRIYLYLLGVYTQLTLEISNSNFYLTNTDKPVPQTLFELNYQNISNFNANYRYLDYDPFRQTPLYNQWKSFNKGSFPKITEHVQSLRYLQIAIVQTEYEACAKGIHDYRPTSLDFLVKRTLERIKQDAEQQREAVSKLLATLDSECSNRYYWQNEKNNIDNSNLDLDRFEKSIDEFIGEK